MSSTGLCREAVCFDNDAFAKVDKAVVELQPVGFFIDGLYHIFLTLKVIRENPKTFQAAVQSAFAEQNL